MKCIFFSNFGEQIGERRLVWNEDPNQLDAARRALAERPIEAGSRDVGVEFNNRIAAGKETVHEAREMRDLNAPINPTKYNLDGLPTDDGSKPEHGLRKRLAWIRDNEVFPRNDPNYRPEVMALYERIRDDFPEAMIRKALVDNATENELLSAFREKLSPLKDKMTASMFHVEVWNYLVDFCSWYSGEDSWGARGENPYLTAVPGITLQPKHKEKMSRQMKELEEHYVARFEEVHSKGFNDYNGARLDFTKETEFPFYREYFLNGAVVNHQTAQQLADSYSEKLKELLRNCITEPSGQLTPQSKQQLQAAEDSSPQEKSDRLGNAQWRAALDAMVEIVRH